MSNIRDFRDVNFDAFGRLRVANPENVFENMQIANKRPEIFDEATTGAGASASHVANNSATDLSVTASTAGSIARQTFRRFAYLPGKSQLVSMTCVPGASGAGITKRWGAFDSLDGVFWQHDASGFSVGIRSSTSGAAVDTIVPEASWNLSQPGLDPTAPNIFVVDFQWLGVGVVRFGYVTPEGATRYVHRFNHPNSGTTVYMRTPNLPIRFYVENSGAGPSSTLRQICASVASEGGTNDRGNIRSLDRGVATLATPNDTNVRPLVAVRMKSTHIRHAIINVLGWSTFAINNELYRSFVCRNPTLSAALTWTPIANSPVEVAYPAVTTTLITAEGDVLSSGYGNGGAKIQISAVADNPRHLGATIAGASDIFVLAHQNFSGQSATVTGALEIRELG